MTKKFEYRIISQQTKGILCHTMDYEKLNNEINKLGSEGWEMVCNIPVTALHDATSEVSFIFKREIIEE